MIRPKKFTAALLSAIMLTGCANSQPATDNEPITTEPDTTGSVSESEELAPSGVLPVIDINTLDTDSLDFVTEPVAQHVAESIASWTPGYVMPPAPYYKECSVSMNDADGSSIITSADAQVKVRGNWTTVYDKKPLRIKFSEKQNVGISSGESFKNWLLLAEYKDGSMLRNKASFNMAESILGSDGLYCTDSQLVEVVINGSYQGVYLLCDMQQTGSGRVDITEPEKNYTGTDIGYFMEFDGYYTQEDDLRSFDITYADNAPLVPFDGSDNSKKKIHPTNDESVGYTIKSDIYSQQQHDFIASYMENVYRIMYSAAYDDAAYVFSDDFSTIQETTDITPREAVEMAVNTDSLADMYIISELTCDADIYWSSFFMDVDFGSDGDKRLTFEAPWDFDSGLGNKDRCADGTGFYAGNIVPDVNGCGEHINPWLNVMLRQEWFRDIVRQKWTDAWESGIFDDTVRMIRSDSETCSAAFDMNYKRWNNLVNNSDFVGELTKKAANCRTHQEAADYLAEWLEARVEFLNSQWHE